MLTETVSGDVCLETAGNFQQRPPTPAASLHKKANDHYADNAGQPDKREGEIEAVTHGRDALFRWL
jgi:hypothetical protein